MFFSFNVYSLIQHSSVTIMIDDEVDQQEGFFVYGNNTDEILFFYRDSDQQGHTNNHGKVVMQRSFDNGSTWGNYTIIYQDDSQDNRNVWGGKTDDGKIVVMWRDFGTKTFWYKYSTDNGYTWSSRYQVETTSSFITPFNRMISIPDNPNASRHYAMFFTKGGTPVSYSWSVVAFWSADGLNWSENNMTTISNDPNIAEDEPGVEYLGDGKLICLIRPEKDKDNYYQVVSTDYGNTWSNPTLTNICPSSFTPCPFVIKLNNTHILVIATARQSSNSSEGGRIWGYLGKIDDVMNDSTAYYDKTEFYEYTAGSDDMFYGYPQAIKVNETTYLVAFTDKNGTTNNNEQAEIRKFYIYFSSDGDSSDNPHFTDINELGNNSQITTGVRWGNATRYTSSDYSGSGVFLGVNSYEIQIANDSGFSDVFANITGINNTYSGVFNQNSTHWYFKLDKTIEQYGGSIGSHYYRTRAKIWARTN